jgi:hypothetical protein
MKKIIVFFFVSTMILGIGMNAYAVDMQLYTEKWVGANYDYHQNETSWYDLTEINDSYKLSSNLLGFDLVARRFYYGAETGFGKIKYPWGSQDLRIADFRFGCRAVKSKVCTLDIFNGFLYLDGVRTYFDNDDGRVALTVGGNLRVNIADRVLFQGCCQIPWAGDVVCLQYESGFLADAPIGLDCRIPGL